MEIFMWHLPVYSKKSGRERNAKGWRKVPFAFPFALLSQPFAPFRTPFATFHAPFALLSHCFRIYSPILKCKLGQIIVVGNVDQHMLHLDGHMAALSL